MVTIILEAEELYYDAESKMIVALKPHLAFLIILRMRKGVIENKETSGLFVTAHWCERNRRASDYLERTLRDRLTSFMQSGHVLLISNHIASSTLHMASR